MRRFIAAMIVSVGTAGVASATEAQFESAVRLYRAGNWQAAVCEFDDVVTAGHNVAQSSLAEFYAAECQIQLGDYRAAGERLERQLALPRAGQERSALLFRAGEAARFQGNYDLARRRLNEFVTRAPGHPHAPFAWKYLGDVAAATDEWATAANCYRTCLRQSPSDHLAPQAQLGLARSFIGLGQIEAAAAAAQTVADDLSQPLAAEALLTIGQAKYLRGSYVAALAAFENLVQRHPATDEAARGRIAAGWALWKLHRLDEVAVVTGPLDDHGPHAQELSVLLGMVAYAQGRFAKAFERLNAAAINNAENGDAADNGCCQFYAGESARRSGRLPQARALLTPIASAEPPCPWSDDALWSLSQIAVVEHDEIESLRLLDQLANRFPKSCYVRQDRAALGGDSGDLLHEALSHQRDGRDDAALAAYGELVADAKANADIRAEALWQAGALHQKLAHYDEAEQLLSQLLTEQPTHQRAPESRLGLAKMAEDRGNRSAASAQFRQLCDKFPQSAQSLEAAYWLAADAADEKDSATAADEARYWAEWLLAALRQTGDAHGRAKRLDDLQRHAEFLLARLDIDDGAYDVARARLQRLTDSLELVDLELPVEFWLAECKFRLGDNGARKAFAELTRRAANTREPWAGMAPLRLAQLQARGQQWTEVLGTLDQLESDHPDFVLQCEVDYLRGRAYAGRGEMRLARSAYRRVLRDTASAGSETAAMAQWMIGETFFHQNELARARETYQRVIDAHSQPAWRARAALQIGKCWELEGAWKKAEAAYRAALQREPQTELKKQLTARLAWVGQQSTIRR